METALIVGIAIAVISVCAGAALAFSNFWGRKEPKRIEITTDPDSTFLYREQPDQSWSVAPEGTKLQISVPPGEIFNRPVHNRRFLAFTCNTGELEKPVGEDQLGCLITDAPELMETRKKRPKKFGDQIDGNQCPGRISLRIQVCSPSPFYARTKDRHRLRIFAKLRFQLTRSGALNAIRFDDFATVLDDRIQAALRAAIGSRRDEELREDQDQISEDVVKKLKDAEAHSEVSNSALGIEIIGFYFRFEEALPNTTNFVRSSVAPTANGQLKALSNGNVAALNNTLIGPMHFSELLLDKVADVFKGRDQEETAALVRLMELQTQQNIVEIMSQSGGLVVMTAKELGLDGDIAKRPGAPDNSGSNSVSMGRMAKGADSNAD